MGFGEKPPAESVCMYCTEIAGFLFYFFSFLQNAYVELGKIEEEEEEELDCDEHRGMGPRLIYLYRNESRKSALAATAQGARS